jgi:predicted RND superfamily exporter protein
MDQPEELTLDDAKSPREELTLGATLTDPEDYGFDDDENCMSPGGKHGGTSDAWLEITPAGDASSSFKAVLTAQSDESGSESGPPEISPSAVGASRSMKSGRASINSMQSLKSTGTTGTMAAINKAGRGWAIYRTTLNAFEHHVAELMSMISGGCARRPYLTLLISFVVCILLMLGLLQMETVTAGGKLWVDQHSEPQANSKVVNELFPSEVRASAFLITAATAGGNALTRDILGETFQLAHEIGSIKSTTGLSFADCFAAGLCSYTGALAFWSNASVFEASAVSDAAVRQALSVAKFPDTGAPVERKLVFGSFETTSGGLLTSAKAFKFHVLIHSEVGSALERALIDHFYDPATSKRIRSYTHLQYDFNAYRSLDDELARNVSNDILLFAGAFVVMALSAALLFGQLGKAVESRISLGFMEFVMLLGCLGAGYGFSALCQVPFTLLHQILPFIILGIGIDDAFVILEAFERTDSSLEPHERIAEAMYRVGVSITMTSLTNMIAFLVGITAKLPAIRYFCLYASMTITVVFVMHLTCFCALLSLDARRQEAKRVDCCCCFGCGVPDVDGDDKKTSSSSCYEGLSQRAFTAYGNFLTSHIAVKLCGISFFFAVLGLAVWSCATGISVGLDWLDLCPDVSYLRDYYVAEKEYFGLLSFGQSIPTMMVFRNMDQSSVPVQAAMDRAANDILSLEFIDAGAGVWSWHVAFTAWAEAHRVAGDDLGGLLPADAFQMVPCSGGTTPGKGCGNFITGSTVVPALKTFLQEPLYKRFSSDIIFDGNRSIRVSRFIARHIDMPDTEQQKDALNEIEDWYNKQDLTFFCFAGWYPVYDQYRIIASELIKTFAMCLVAVLIVSVVVLIHPISMAMMVFVLGMIFTMLLASLNMWELQLNAVSSICLVMSIGLVVDYSAHIMHNFVMQPSIRTRDERVVLTLGEMGPSVGLGCLSTFLAIVPLALARSQIFRIFFKCFVGIVVVGASHGLIFVPALLSVMGPNLRKSNRRWAWKSKTSPKAQKAGLTQVVPYSAG